MYKILFITLIVLSASILAHPEADTGAVQLNGGPPGMQGPSGRAKPIELAGASASASSGAKANGGIPIKGNTNNGDKGVPQNGKPASTQSKNKPRTGFNGLKPANKRQCYNRFDYGGFQVDQDCVVCAKGTHEKSGKCISNAIGCSSKVLTKGSCKKCNFWQWPTVSTVQGNYCVNRWWMWVIIFTSGIVALALLVSAISFFACCPTLCSKKQSSESSKGPGGEKKSKNENPYDKGYGKGKPGCCGCFKKEKKEYVSGYSTTERF